MSKNDYCNTIFHVAGAKIIRDIKSGHNSKQRQIFRTGKRAHKRLEQLSLSVPAAWEDLAPQVQAGCGRGEHDQELLLQTKAAHALGGVVAARPGEDLLGDVVGVECVTVET